MQLIDVVPILKAPMLHTWKKRDLLNALKDAPAVDPVHMRVLVIVMSVITGTTGIKLRQNHKALNAPVRIGLWMVTKSFIRSPMIFAATAIPTI